MRFFDFIRKGKIAVSQFKRLCVQVDGSAFFLRKMLLEDKILNSHECGVSDEKYCDTEIIVSLTTYGRRVDDVCFTIESLMQQTRKANRIVLWLDQRDRDKSLPRTLQLQQARGLEVRYTKDIRSYTKLIPALIAFPDAAIITVDDDLIYEFDILDRIISSYLLDPKSIHACRTHVMKFDKNDNLMSYNDWQMQSYDMNLPKRNFITGVGGTLYPPYSLSPEVLNEEVFTAICPTADDVWFTAMALVNGTSVRKVATRSGLGEDYCLNPSVQDMGLFRINTGENGHNDRQISAVFNKYGIYQLIKQCPL